MLQAGCDAALPPAVLHFLTSVFKKDDLLGRLVANNATLDVTVEEIARFSSESLSERIAVNEQRLLRAPTIIEALYKNRNTRMSTADRLIELCARNGVVLHGIPSFEAAVEAVQSQLIPERSDEPLPQDLQFQTTLAEDRDENAFEEDKAAGIEEVKQAYKPLSMQIVEMSKSEKLRLALVGNMAARAILVRDHNKQVSMAAIQSPQMTVGEAANMARSKEVGEDVLRYIGNKKEWIKSSEVKHNLCFNSKTPVGISMRFISHLRMEELKALAKNRNVSAQLKSMATQWVTRKEKKDWLMSCSVSCSGDVRSRTSARVRTPCLQQGQFGQMPSSRSRSRARLAQAKALARSATRARRTRRYECRDAIAEGALR